MALSIMLLQGCTVLSTNVAAIGEKAQFGFITPADATTGKVLINETTLGPRGQPWMCDGNCTIPLPYVESLGPNQFSKNPIGEFPFTTSADGHATTVIMDRPTEFQHDNEMNNTPNGSRQIYRTLKKPYWYPAQLLQVVAVPGDIALSAVIVTGMVVVLPIIYVAEKIGSH